MKGLSRRIVCGKDLQSILERRDPVYQGKNLQVRVILMSEVESGISASVYRISKPEEIACKLFQDLKRYTGMKLR
jgi:hypothetical protein